MGQNIPYISLVVLITCLTTDQLRYVCLNFSL